MNRTANRNASGFTLIEVLLAVSMVSMLMGVVAAAVAVSRANIRIEGSEIVDGRTLALNPDDTVAGRAHGLATELRSLIPSARFVICADKPLTEAMATNYQTLPYARKISSEAARVPADVRERAQEVGAEFDPSEGFTVWVVGAGAQAIATLTVTKTEVASVSGEVFQCYQTKLFGAYDAGFGILYQYEFITPSATAQPIVPPIYQDGVWRFALPDPALMSSKPDGSPADVSESGIIIDAIARF